MTNRLHLYTFLLVFCLSFVLPGYPENTLDIPATLSNALAEIRVFNFSDAYNAYAQVRAATEEGSETWQEATFCLAVCAQQRTPLQQSSIDEAEALYNEILEKTPNSKYAPRATMNIGRVYELSDFHEDPVDLEKARAYYENVIERWPHERIASEAALRVAASYIQTYEDDNVAKGIAFLEKWLEDHPDDPLVALMWQYLGKMYLYPVENYAKSFECYERADSFGILTKTQRGNIYWNMAKIAEEQLTNRTAAVKYYTKIITDEPTSGKAYESQIALRRLGAPVPEISIFTRAISTNTPRAKE